MHPHFMGLDVALVGDYTSVAIGHNWTPEGKVVLDFIDRIKCWGGRTLNTWTDWSSTTWPIGSMQPEP